MRIPRFYIPADYQPGLVITLNKEQVHYALTVLRLKSGHQIEAFDGRGHCADAQLHVINKREATLTLNRVKYEPKQSPLNTVLVQGISRGERMDYSLQKAVELGVTAIQPVFTERCEVRLDAEKSDKRREQWQTLVISACEQSGRNVVPQVYPAQPLTHWLNQSDHLGMVLDPYAEQGLQHLQAPPMHAPWHILIGPEGGLSEEEVQQAKQQGLTPVRLGQRILRTETVAPVILALVQNRWGDLN